MIRMNFVAGNQLEPCNVTRAQFQIAIARVRRIHDQHGLLHFQRRQRGAKLLGLRLFHVEGAHDRQLAIGKLRRQSGTQCTQKLLAGKCVVVGPWNRTMHGAAVPPQWRADRADTGASRSFLLPQLPARTGNLPAGLGGVRAAMLPGAVVLHRLPEQIFVDRTENLIGQIERSDLFAAQIVNINRCHILLGTKY